jgi:hypothetical protein
MRMRRWTRSSLALAIAALVPGASSIGAAPVRVQQEVPREGWGNIKPPPPTRPARLVITDFAGTPGDAQAASIGRAIADVLWNDLDFEREFDVLPRGAGSDSAAPPDAVIEGTVLVESGIATVDVRLVPVGSRDPLFSRRYTGSTANPRAFAHTISDQIHERAIFRMSR